MRPALMLLLLRRAHAFARHAAFTRRRITTNAKPALVVWDMDDCLWSPEMFTLSEMPSDPVRGDLNGRGEGVYGRFRICRCLLSFSLGSAYMSGSITIGLVATSRS